MLWISWFTYYIIASVYGHSNQAILCISHIGKQVCSHHSIYNTYCNDPVERWFPRTQPKWSVWCYSGHIHELKINYEKYFSVHLNLLILSQNWFCVCNSAFLMHPDPHMYLVRMSSPHRTIPEVILLYFQHVWPSQKDLYENESGIIWWLPCWCTGCWWLMYIQSVPGGGCRSLGIHSLG